MTTNTSKKHDLPKMPNHPKLKDGEYRVFGCHRRPGLRQVLDNQNALAAYVHFLHLSSAERMVVNTMRWIDFLLNRIAPVVAVRKRPAFPCIRRIGSSVNSLLYRVLCRCRCPAICQVVLTFKRSARVPIGSACSILPDRSQPQSPSYPARHHCTPSLQGTLQSPLARASSATAFGVDGSMTDFPLACGHSSRDKIL
jgi:hypothetical protein